MDEREGRTPTRDCNEIVVVCSATVDQFRDLGGYEVIKVAMKFLDQTQIGSLQNFGIRAAWRVEPLGKLFKP